MKIHSKKSQSTDIHGVICETKKLATSDFSVCDFEYSTDTDYENNIVYYGSFSFKPTDLSYEVKCSKLIQTGFYKLFHTYNQSEPSRQFSWNTIPDKDN